MPPGVYVRKKKDYSIYHGAKPKPCPTPTIKHQALYNNWRDAERHSELEKKGFQMGPLRLVNPNPKSNTLSPFLDPARSRSSSADSSTRTANGDTSVEECEDRPRGRGGRTGPLEARTRAKAAFMRALGACDVCRNRRVGCFREHWDLSLFERSWCDLRGLPYKEAPPDPEPQVESNPDSEPELSVPTSGSSVGSSPSSSRFAGSPFAFSSKSNQDVGLFRAPQRDENVPQKNRQHTQKRREATQSTNAFLQLTYDDTTTGAGPSQAAGLNALPKRRIQNKRNGALEPILAQRVNKRHHLENLLGVIDSIPGQVFATAPLQSTEALSPLRYKHVALGSQVRPDKDEWACLWNHKQPTTTDAGIAGDGRTPCTRRSRSLASHIFHFHQEHHPFDAMDFLLRCKSCLFNWTTNSTPFGARGPCPQCSEMAPHEKVLWGSLIEISTVRWDPPTFIMVTAEEERQPVAFAPPEEAIPSFGGVKEETLDGALAQPPVDFGSYPPIGIATSPISVSSPGNSMHGLEEFWRPQIAGLEPLIEGGQGQEQHGISGWFGVTGTGGSFSGGYGSCSLGFGSQDGVEPQLQGIVTPSIEVNMDLGDWYGYVEPGMELDQVEILRRAV